MTIREIVPVSSNREQRATLETQGKEADDSVRPVRDGSVDRNDRRDKESTSSEKGELSIYLGSIKAARMRHIKANVGKSAATYRSSRVGARIKIGKKLLLLRKECNYKEVRGMQQSAKECREEYTK